MAIDFSGRLIVANPTLFHFGRGVACAGLVAITAGGVSYLACDFLGPAGIWCAVGVPALVAGIIMAVNGVRKG